LTSAQKDNIDAILDEQVVFNRNGEVQRFLIVGWVDLTQIPLRLLEILCSSLTQIFGNTIRVGQYYTQRGWVSLIPGELVGTPDPHHKLYEYMDRDGVGWPSLSRFGWETKPIGAHFIVILFI
jgi:hypothetical protein